MKQSPSYLVFSVLFLSLLLLVGSSTFAQFANDWIEYDQQYLKIGVPKRGIYKVSYDALKKNGLPITEANKANLQVYHKGVEISTIDLSNDYVAFYGEPNDGSSDSLLYRPTSARMNPYYSLFSDEGFYFFTIGKQKGKKPTTVNPISTQNKIDWHWAESIQTFPEEYTHYIYSVELPSLLQSYFTNQETFASKPKSGITNDKYTIALKDFAHLNGVTPQLTLMVNGRTNGANKIEVIANEKALTTLDFSGIRGITHQTSLTNFNTSQKQVDINLKSTLSTGRYAVTYIKLDYPQSLNSLATQQEILRFKSINKVSLVEINSSMATKDYLAIDISDPTNLRSLQLASEANKVSFPINNTTTNVLITPLSDIYEVSAIYNTSFKKVAPDQINFLIISNSHLKDAVQQYSSYRSSDEGGNYKTHIADITSVYDEFNYGEPSPIAIRQYVQYLLSDKNWNKYLLLVGQTTSVESRIKKGLIGVPDNNASYTSYSQIPTVGYPGSDVLLVDGLDSLGRQNIPGIPVGRIAAMDPNEVIEYLNKVKEYESNSNQGWKKNVLHISGGHSIEEINSFKNILGQFESTIANSSLGGQVSALVKPNLNPTQKVNLLPHINNGVGMISYFGHGNAIITDYDIGYATPTQNQINNKGKYPFMYFNGCGVGNIFSGRYSTDLTAAFSRAISTDWLLAKEKGAIAILANSYDSYTSTSTKYLQSFYKLLYEKGDRISIGDIQKLAAYHITQQSATLYDIANLHQSVLQGDPSLKLFNIALPDYTTGNAEDFSISASNSSTIANATQLEFKFPVKNLGRFNKSESLPIQVSFLYNDDSEVTKTLQLKPVAYSDTVIISIDNVKPLETIVVTIDQSGQLQESDKTNNSYTFLINWDDIKHLMSFKPEIYIDNIAPTIRVKNHGNLIGHNAFSDAQLELTIQLDDNQFLSTQNEDIEVYLKTPTQQSFQKVNTTFSNLKIEGKTASLNLVLENLTDGEYELLIVGKDKSGNASQPYQTAFVIRNNSEVTVTVGPNPASTYVRFAVTADNNLENVIYSIFSTNGTLIEKREILKSESGDYQWYWYPKVAGLYIYKAQLAGKNNKIISGKILVDR